jgi:hypothetical protein
VPLARDPNIMYMFLKVYFVVDCTLAQAHTGKICLRS